jgi:alkaline phosphatase D
VLTQDDDKANSANSAVATSGAALQSSTQPQSNAALEPALPKPSLPLPSGLAAGEVTSTSVLLWSRCDRDARLHVAMNSKEGPRHESQLVRAGSDFAGTFELNGLTAATLYEYQMWCSEDADLSPQPRVLALSGSFKTAPDKSDGRTIRFAWSGDLGGQNVCRDAAQGYPIFEPLKAGNYDFFVALGDLIYADTACEAVGLWGNPQLPLATREATTLSQFHDHWRYNRDDAKYRAFLATTPQYNMWDDHEVINDFGPSTDVRGQAPYRAGERLMPLGLQAMLDYNPLPKRDDRKLYRRHRFGKHVELFFVDARQYREANERTDTAALPKAMLGEEQVRWLVSGLTESDATWKFVISGVPLSTPTGLHKNARDGFANYDSNTGFERELSSVLRALQTAGVTHTIWLITDVHIAAGFDYTPFPEDPGFVVHEFIAGPLSAGFFPRNEYDKSFNPKRHFTWAVDNVVGLKDYEAAKALFNYGEVTVTEAMVDVAIVNTFGTKVAGVTLQR